MLSELDEQRIVRAIADAERGNRAEVRVHIEPECAGDALQRARSVYAKLGLARTNDDTAVLLYVAPRSRVAAVFSGAGVPDQAPNFWQAVVQGVADGYREDKPADAIVAALNRVGDVLRLVVGGQDRHGNELADQITTARDLDTAYAGPPVDEAGESFACVHCGAPLNFDLEHDSDPTCDYCGVINGRAQALLRKRRAQGRRQQRQRAALTRRIIIAASAVLFAVLVLVLLGTLHTQSELQELHSEAERAKSQVTNVVERQKAVRERYQGRADSPGKDAELNGAENRVRIERARYDQAAQRYNAEVGTGWGAFSAKLWGLPARVSLSDDAKW